MADRLLLARRDRAAQACELERAGRNGAESAARIPSWPGRPGSAGGGLRRERPGSRRSLSASSIGNPRLRGALRVRGGGPLRSLQDAIRRPWPHGSGDLEHGTWPLPPVHGDPRPPVEPARVPRRSLPARLRPVLLDLVEPAAAPHRAGARGRRAAHCRSSGSRASTSARRAQASNSRSPTCSTPRRSSTRSRSEQLPCRRDCRSARALCHLVPRRGPAPPFPVVALLACTTKEEIPLAIGCLGIWYAVRQGHRALRAQRVRCRTRRHALGFLWLIPRYAPHGVDSLRHSLTGCRRHAGRNRAQARLRSAGLRARRVERPQGGLRRPPVRTVPRPLSAGAAASAGRRAGPGDQSSLEAPDQT